VNTTYTVMYTEQAAAKRDALPPERRQIFEKGIQALCEDPFTEVSHPLGGDWREVRLTSRILIEYSVHAGQLVVLVVRIFDDSDVIIPEH
jgi:mRNA-degrading endonuclease RelE of RelBE toxin-antitoxin system